MHIPQAPSGCPATAPQHPVAPSTVLLVSSVEGSQASLQRIRGGQFLGSSSLRCVSSWQQGGQWGPHVPPSPGTPHPRGTPPAGIPCTLRPPQTPKPPALTRTWCGSLRVATRCNSSREMFLQAAQSVRGPGPGPGIVTGAGAAGGSSSSSSGGRQRQRWRRWSEAMAGRCRHRRRHRALMGWRQVGNPRGRWLPPPVTAKSPPPSKAEPIPGRGPRAAPRRARPRAPPGRDGTGRKTRGSSWRLRARGHRGGSGTGRIGTPAPAPGPRRPVHLGRRAEGTGRPGRGGNPRRPASSSSPRCPLVVPSVSPRFVYPGVSPSVPRLP